MMRYHSNYKAEKTLTKDSRFKQISGVCAGIAKHYGWPRWGIRIAAIIALFSFPMVTGVAYLLATVLLEEG